MTSLSPSAIFETKKQVALDHDLSSCDNYVIMTRHRLVFFLFLAMQCAYYHPPHLQLDCVLRVCECCTDYDGLQDSPAVSISPLAELQRPLLPSPPAASAPLLPIVKPIVCVVDATVAAAADARDKDAEEQQHEQQHQVDDEEQHEERMTNNNNKECEQDKNKDDDDDEDNDEDSDYQPPKAKQRAGSICERKTRRSPKTTTTQSCAVGYARQSLVARRALEAHIDTLVRHTDCAIQGLGYPSPFRLNPNDDFQHAHMPAFMTSASVTADDMVQREALFLQEAKQFLQARFIHMDQVPAERRRDVFIDTFCSWMPLQRAVVCCVNTNKPLGNSKTVPHQKLLWLINTWRQQRCWMLPLWIATSAGYLRLLEESGMLATKAKFYDVLELAVLVLSYEYVIPVNPDLIPIRQRKLGCWW